MTPPNSRYCEPYVPQQVNGTIIIKTIVHWHHQRGSAAHCLARIYLPPAKSSAVVLLSQIRSNQRHMGIGADFGSVASALYDCLKSKAIDVDPLAITWIAHYGSFSSYEAVGEEKFIQIVLPCHGQQFGAMAQEQRLDAKAIKALLGRMSLESVYQALREIGWTKHNDGYEAIAPTLLCLEDHCDGEL